jgi:membrane protein required for colicin V production
MDSLPIVDIVIGVILIWGAISGFRKGLISSLASFVAIIAGALAAYYGSDAIAAQLVGKVDWSQKQIAVASFAIAFLGVVLLVHLLAKMLGKILDLVALGFVNKISGAVFGALKNALLITFLIFGLKGFGNWIPEDLDDDCVIYPAVESIAPLVLPYWEDLGRKLTSNSLKRKSRKRLKTRRKRSTK